MNATERARDSYGSWSLAIQAWREQRVRSGEYTPIDERERRQRAEGPHEPDQLECVLCSGKGWWGGMHGSSHCDDCDGAGIIPA